LLHGRFLLFNSAYIGKQRPPMQPGGQQVQPVVRARRINLHSSVIFIANPSAKAQLCRALFDEPPETHPLHAAVHKPPSGMDF
jgi:hypothetical protein